MSIERNGGFHSPKFLKMEKFGFGGFSKGIFCENKKPVKKKQKKVQNA
jgi:hypothetical protein